MMSIKLKVLVRDKSFLQYKLDTVDNCLLASFISTKKTTLVSILSIKQN